MNFMKKSLVYYTIYVSLICLNCFSVYGNNVDSLLNLCNNAQDTSKIRLLIDIGWELRGIDTDKSIEYYNKAIASADKLNDQKQKARALHNIGVTYNRMAKYDTAIECFKKALEIRTIIKDSMGLAASLGSIGDCYGYKGDIKISMEYTQKAIEISRKIGKQKLLSGNLSNLAVCYYTLGQIDKALDFFLQALKINEEIHDYPNTGLLLNNIASIYSSMNNFKKAKEYLFQSLEIQKKLNDKRGLAFCYSNIGTIYYEETNLKESYNYFVRAIRLQEEVNDPNGLSESYNNMSKICRTQNDFSKAIEYDKKAIKIRQEIGDKIGQAQSWCSIGKSYRALNDYKNSINAFNTSLEIAAQVGDKNQISDTYKELALTYSDEGDFKNAFQNYQKYSTLKDSVYNENTQKQFSEMQTKYETEKKQKEIELLNKDKIINEAELKKQTVIRNSFIIGFVFILLIVLILYNRYIIKKKANTQLSLQNQLILQQKEEIETQRDEILDKNEILEIQKAEIMRKHDENQEQKKEILDSIHYAKRIQKAILPPEEYVTKNLPAHFILFKPRDIVSGDFYWAKVVNNTLVYCVADCTGHGVPGAFMSMLGIAFLNEIINKYQIEPSKKIVPAEILDNLREMVISSLHQTGKTGEQKDGMDISMIALNLTTIKSSELESLKSQIPNSNAKDQNSESVIARNEAISEFEHQNTTTNNEQQTTNFYKVQWAGANNPLYLVTQSSGLLLDEGSQVKTPDRGIVRDTETTNQMFALQEVKPDKMPIGIYYGEKHPFTNHEFTLTKGDTIYIFSDGFADQFGGPEGKKFKYSQFKNIINDMTDNYIEDQKYILDYAFELWKGDNSQLDDICIIGLKL